MRRRQAAAKDQMGGLEIGEKTPAETRATKQVTPITEVRIPRAQAFWTSWPWSVAAVLTALLPLVVGPYVFWAATFCIATAAFFWELKFGLHWQDKVIMPILGGLAGFCLWRFYSFVGPRTYITVVVAAGGVLFWWLFASALSLTFVQRLGMPMYHQQYSIWRALGNVLEYKLKREPEESEVVEPEPRKLKIEVLEKNGHIRHNVEPPVDADTFVAVAEILLENTYCEANLCGTDKPLPGGKRGREMLRELRDWMIEWGILTWNKTNGNGEPLPRQGVSLTGRGHKWLKDVLSYPTDDLERSDDENEW